MTFIDHNGYLLEAKDTYFLFDYWKGEMPKFDNIKSVVVFVSHKYADHYNSEVFELIKEYEHVILAVKNTTFEVTLPNHKILKVTTLKSTDLGVAFLLELEYGGRVYYHARDLNLWLWEDNDKEAKRVIIKKYFQCICGIVMN